MISYVPDVPDIIIPPELLPSDGRFGSGPSKVRPAQIDALADVATTYMGTSHRQKTVKAQVGRVRAGMRQLFSLPDGYEVVLGNGGTTCFWDAATFGLIEEQSQHLSFGEFSSKFAACAKAAPHLKDPQVIESEFGTHPKPAADPSVDLYALTHNETSTGVSMPIRRPQGAAAPADGGGLVAVDGTSGGGGLRVDPAEFDAYYLAPQKCFAGDGGLWIALLSPAALQRVERIAASDRWIPTFLDLKTAIDNSVLDQTYNTPALATLLLLAEQVEWMLANGGMAWTTERSATSSGILYNWADKSPVATPFVADPAQRSPVVVTIDLADSIAATAVSKALRANGIVDTDSYRKLGRNQLRIGTFPAIEPADVEALTACIDYVLERM